MDAMSNRLVFLSVFILGVSIGYFYQAKKIQSHWEDEIIAVRQLHWEVKRDLGYLDTRVQDLEARKKGGNR